jgi:hypothetical protein
VIACSLSAVADALLGVAAIGGLVVAVLGLRTWRSELAGQKGHDIAFRCVASALRVRDELGRVRAPGISVGEQVTAMRECRGSVPDDPDKFELSAVYDWRFRHLDTAFREFQSACNEAEALWGSSYGELDLPLRMLRAKLFATIHSYMRSHAANKVFPDEKMAIVWSDFSDPDSFGNEIVKAIDDLRTTLEPKIAA